MKNKKGEGIQWSYIVALLAALILLVLLLVFGFPAISKGFTQKLDSLRGWLT